MKRIVSLALSLAVALGLTGCAKPVATSTGGGSTTTTAPVTSPADGEHSGWKAMPLGAHEKERLGKIDGSVAAYTQAEKAAGRVPLVLSGVKPVFVGYQMTIWAKRGNGKYRFSYFDCLSDRLVVIGVRPIPLSLQSIRITENAKDHFSAGVTPKSAGEKRAVAKALAWANKNLPGYEWNAEIVAYDFFFGVNGPGRDAVLSMTPAGTGYRLQTVATAK